MKEYNEKERDLVERERLFEIRMKEQHDAFQAAKLKQEEELHQRELSLNSKEEDMVLL
jgi:hypothetical protein